MIFLLRFGLGWAAALVMAGIAGSGAWLLVSLCRPRSAGRCRHAGAVSAAGLCGAAPPPGFRICGSPMPDCAWPFPIPCRAPASRRSPAAPALLSDGRRDPHRHLSGLRRARAGRAGGVATRRSRRLHPHDAAGADAADGSGAGAWRHHRPADRRRLCRLLECAAGRCRPCAACLRGGQRHGGDGVAGERADSRRSAASRHAAAGDRRRASPPAR